MVEICLEDLLKREVVILEKSFKFISDLYSIDKFISIVLDDMLFLLFIILLIEVFD